MFSEGSLCCTETFVSRNSKTAKKHTVQFQYQVLHWWIMAASNSVFWDGKFFLPFNQISVLKGPQYTAGWTSLLHAILMGEKLNHGLGCKY